MDKANQFEEEMGILKVYNVVNENINLYSNL